MISEIEENRDRISRLCQQFGGKRLEVCGSAATGAFNAASVIRKLIEPDPGEWAEHRNRR